jgi:hypothetical protein
MRSVPACQFTGRLFYQLIKAGQLPDTTHVSKQQEFEIGNAALPKFAHKKKILAAFVCLFFHMLQVEKR